MTTAGSSATARDARASVYARCPSTFLAEYAGGCCAKIAARPESVWLANGHLVLRVDPRTNAVVMRIPIAAIAADVAADSSAVYIAAAPAT